MNAKTRTQTQTQNATAAAADEAVEFEALDRSSFLLKGILGAGAIYGAAAVGPTLSQVFAQGGDADAGDIEILNFALTLEYLEADFYDQAVKNVDLSGELKSLAEEIGQNEQDHVDALAATIKELGGKPAKEPKFSFDLSDEKSFLALAVTFEDTGVSAYNGAGPSLKSKELLATAGTIVQVEGRHAAAVRIMDGQLPVVDAFDPTLDMQQVLDAVSPFIQS